MKNRCGFILVFFLFVFASEMSFAESIGPYLLDPRPESINVLWRTDTETTGQVKCWPVSDPVQSRLFEESTSTTAHLVELTSLDDNTTYSYQVGSNESFGSVFQFQTPSDDMTSLRFVFWGDTRYEPPISSMTHQEALTSRILEAKPRFILNTGDIVMWGIQTHWDAFWEMTAKPDPNLTVHGKIPLYPVLGNHDYYGASYLIANTEQAVDLYQGYFCALPPNNATAPDMHARYYSFHYGPVYTIILDVNNEDENSSDTNDYISDGSPIPNWTPGNEQYDWMIAELEKAQSYPIRFIAFHHAPYSSGVHGNPDDPLPGYPLRLFDPVFRQYGVTAVFTGHDHFYERSETIEDGKSVWYYISGGGSNSIRNKVAGWESWMWDAKNNTYYTKAFDSSNHIVVVDIQLEIDLWLVKFTPIREDGSTFDITELYVPDLLSQVEDWVLF